MSQKSTARTGSECDADFKDFRRTTKSESSSCRSKRDIFGGPFGDSPYDQAQDYLFLMFRNNDGTSDTSDSSQDNELYNLKNDYTEQLNSVRKKLNLMELTEDHQGCTITEIIDGESVRTKREETIENQSNSSSQRMISTDRGSERNKSQDCSFHPFSVTYNLQSGSRTNFFEPDYSPPKKKVCQRLITPRFISMSEGHVPYHTKVGIHETLFRKEHNDEEPNNKYATKVLDQFTETRQTQCNEEEFYSSRKKRGTEPKMFLDLVQSLDKISTENSSCETEERSGSGVREEINSGVLFPNVIVETKNQTGKERSSISSRSSKKYSTSSSCKSTTRKKEGEVLSLNSIRGSSDEECDSVTKFSTTTVETSEIKSLSKKRRLDNRTDSSHRVTMWEEICRLRSGTDGNKMEVGGGDTSRTGSPSPGDCHKLNDYIGKLSENIQLKNAVKDESSKGSAAGERKSKFNQYVLQYVQYKREVEKAKSTTPKKHSKFAIIGHRVVNIQNKLLDSTGKLHHSETSLISDDEKCDKSSSSPDLSENATRRTFWEKICCLCVARSASE